MESGVTLSGGTSTDNPSLSHQWNNSNGVQPNQAPAGCKDVLADGKGLDREELCRLVSEYRAQFGLGPVKLNAILDLASQLHAEDMMINNYFSHYSRSGAGVAERVAAYGVKNLQLGENIAVGQETAQIVFKAWIDSAGHRANILQRTFTTMGIGRSGNFWVQTFSQ